MRIARMKAKTLGSFSKEWLEVDIGALGEKRGREFHRLQHKEAKIFLGAYDGKKMVGYASGKVKGGVAHMGSLFIRKATRGTGVGTALARAFEKEARRLGGHTITVNSLKELKNVGFYRALGYMVEGTFYNKKNKITLIRLYKYL